MTSNVFAAAKKRIREMGKIEYVDLEWANDNDAVIRARVSGILGADDEFTGGEYLADIVMGPEYPARPPHVRFLTPNGVTQVGVFISINRFGYHDEAYTAASGAYGVAALLPAVLIQWRELGPGVGLLDSQRVDALADIRSAARASKVYNKEHLQHVH